jgi:hypothetical protein
MYERAVTLNVLKLLLTTATVLPNFVGNTLVCLVVKKDKSYHTFVNFLLVHLSVTDIVVGIFGFVEVAIDVFVQDKPTSAVCKLLINQNLVLIGTFSSLLTIVMISVHRYLGIVKPLKSMKYTNVDNLKFIVPLTWIFSIVAFSVRIHKSLSLPGCKDFSISDKTNSIGGVSFMGNLIGFVGGFLIPVAILGYLFWKINTALRNRHTTLRIGAAGQHAVSNSRKTTTRRLGYVILAFCMSTLPFQIVTFLKAVFNFEESVWGGISDVLAYCIFIAGSSFNPFLYWFSNRRFRQRAAQILRKHHRVVPR